MWNGWVNSSQNSHLIQNTNTTREMGRKGKEKQKKNPSNMHIHTKLLYSYNSRLTVPHNTAPRFRTYSSVLVFQHSSNGYTDRMHERFSKLRHILRWLLLLLLLLSVQLLLLLLYRSKWFHKFIRLEPRCQMGKWWRVECEKWKRREFWIRQREKRVQQIQLRVRRVCACVGWVGRRVGRQVGVDE